MKKSAFFVFAFLPFVLLSQGSASHSADFTLGSGLSFRFNDGEYAFSLGGMIQPGIAMVHTAGQQNPEFIYLARHSFFHLKGSAEKEKLDFCIRTDFSQGQPLLDVYIDYRPLKFLTLTFGQKQNPASNREMLFLEDRLSFSDRRLMSTEYSQSGREFGVFAASDFSMGSFSLRPSIAVTSGDGRNSFGVDSRDVDLGSLKYGARLDLFPLGSFSPGNDLQAADLYGEEKIKLVLGMAASLNRGASEKVGEGHGEFLLYDGDGMTKLPDLRQLYADILVKWKGLSLLGQYVISTAASLEGSFTDAAGQNPLVPTEISEYLALGHGYQVQIGYCFRKTFGVDLSYAGTTPEFKYNPDSEISEKEQYSISFTRYLSGDDLKVQLSGSLLSGKDSNEEYQAELLVQLRM